VINADLLFLKAFGALLGAVAGLLFVRPKNLLDMLCRLLFSIIAGAVLYFVPVELFRWDIANPERVMAGAMLVAFASPWLAGPLIKRFTVRTGEE
jgi:hypothetical protein